MPTDPETLNRYDQAVQLEKFLDSHSITAQLGSPEQRHIFIQALDGEQFASFLQQVNAVILAKPADDNPFASEFNFSERTDGEFPDMMPAPEDKEQLVRDVLASAQRLDDPGLQAMVIGFGINAVHPFPDGNGRLARAMYVLLSRDYEPGNPDLYGALGKKGNNTVLLDSSLFTPITFSIFKRQLGTHQLDPQGLPIKPKIWPVTRMSAADFLLREHIETTRREFNDDEFQCMKAVFTDQNLGSMLTYLLATQTTSRTARKAIIEMPAGTVFAFDDFLTHASDKEMAKAYDYFRMIKRQQVHLLLDLLAGQGEYSGLLLPHPDGPSGRGISVQKFGRFVADHLFETAFIIK